jgi:hypothetical protein
MKLAVLQRQADDHPQPLACLAKDSPDPFEDTGVSVSARVRPTSMLTVRAGMAGVG